MQAVSSCHCGVLEGRSFYRNPSDHLLPPPLLVLIFSSTQDPLLLRPRDPTDSTPQILVTYHTERNSLPGSHNSSVSLYTHILPHFAICLIALYSAPITPIHHYHFHGASYHLPIILSTSPTSTLYAHSNSTHSHSPSIIHI